MFAVHVSFWIHSASSLAFWVPVISLLHFSDVRVLRFLIVKWRLGYVSLFKMSEIEGCRISSEYNGLYFCNTFIARELVALILTQVDYQSLIASCRLVCKQWNSIITDPLFWKHKTVSENRKWPSLPRECNIPWSFYASVYIYDPVDRNLIRNPNGKCRFSLFGLRLHILLSAKKLLLKTCCIPR